MNIAENMLAISNIKDPITRNKLFLLQSVKSIGPTETERVKRAAENVTVEAVEYAVMTHLDMHDNDMQVFDNVNMCASVSKNGMNLLLADEVK